MRRVMRDRGNLYDNWSKSEFLANFGSEVNILGREPDDFESLEDWADSTLEEIYSESHQATIGETDYRFFSNEGVVVVAQDDFSKMEVLKTDENQYSIGTALEYLSGREEAVDRVELIETLETDGSSGIPDAVECAADYVGQSISEVSWVDQVDSILESNELDYFSSGYTYNLLNTGYRLVVGDNTIKVGEESRQSESAVPVVDNLSSLDEFQSFIEEIK